MQNLFSFFCVLSACCIRLQSTISEESLAAKGINRDCYSRKGSNLRGIEAFP